MPAPLPISIRPYELADIPSLYEAARESTATVFPWLPWCHPGYEIAEAREWVAMQVENFKTGKEYNFVIRSPEGRFLGACGLNQINTLYRFANLGYWLRTSATGQGAAPQAVRLLADWAFRNTDLHRLEILVAVENTRSLRVAEKAGAVREGILRGRLFMHDHFHDTVVFSILRGDRVSREEPPQ